MWPGTESNRRHEDFQSSALPTELPGRDHQADRQRGGPRGVESQFPWRGAACGGQILSHD